MVRARRHSSTSETLAAGASASWSPAKRRAATLYQQIPPIIIHPSRLQNPPSRRSAWPTRTPAPPPAFPSRPSRPSPQVTPRHSPLLCRTLAQTALHLATPLRVGLPQRARGGRRQKGFYFSYPSRHHYGPWLSSPSAPWPFEALCSESGPHRVRSKLAM